MTRVLIVDDDLDIQLLLRLELVAEGHEVATADNGREALEEIGREPPDVVLLDVMMPVLDGWGVLEALDTVSGPAVIMISAYSSDRGAAVARAIGLGAFDFVQKPFDPGQLIELIDTASSLDRAGRDRHREARLAEL